MADKKISELTSETPASGDEIPVHDVSGGDTNKIQISDLAGDGLQAGSPLGVDVSQFAGTGVEDDGSENIRIASGAAGNGLTGGSGSALGVATDGIQTDELDLSIAPTWTSEHNFHGGISTSSGALNLSATTNTDQLNLRTDGNNAMANSLKVGGTGAAEHTLDVRGQAHIVSNNKTLELSSASADSNAELYFQENFNDRWRVGTSASGTDLRFRDEVNAAAPLTLVAGTNPSVQITTPSSATGTTLVVSGSGLNEIQRDSSSRRYKSDITPITSEDVDPARVLAIDPAFYERDGSPEIGFIAEDFEQGILAHGLGYDEQGRVHGFLAGSRVIDAAQQVVLQDHEKRLQELEERVA